MYYSWRVPKFICQIIMLKETWKLNSYLHNIFLFSPFSGSADTLLKKNAEPILHIAGLDITIVKVSCT